MAELKPWMDKPLKLCPFCGAKWNRLFVEKNEIGLFYVECSTNDYGCGATGPAAISEDDAIEAWNRRAGNGN